MTAKWVLNEQAEVHVMNLIALIHESTHLAMNMKICGNTEAVDFVWASRASTVYLANQVAWANDGCANCIDPNQKRN